MTMERLSHVGPEIHFDIKPVTIPTKVSRRPLMIMGVPKAILDILDSDGALDSDALLTGPAVVDTGTKATYAAWADCQGFKLILSLNGVPQSITVPATIADATALAAYLTTQLAATATFGGITVEAFDDGSTPPADVGLRLTSINIGEAVDLYIDPATHANFLLDGATGSGMEGRHTYGFGNYKGFDVTVPFLSIPDPDGIIDYLVLDSAFQSTIQVSVNRGDRVESMSKTKAWERHCYQRPGVYPVASGTLAAYADYTDWASYYQLGGFSPVMETFATDYPPELYPWAPSIGGTTLRFWCPGSPARVLIPGATPLGYVALEWTVNLDTTKPTEIPETTSELSDYHGHLGNDMMVSVAGGAGPGTESVTIVAGPPDVLTIVTENEPGGPTVQGVLDAINNAITDSTNDVYGALRIVDYLGPAVLIGANALAATPSVTTFTGGVAPLLFDATESVCTLKGNKLFTTNLVGETLAGPVSLRISVDGSPVEEFNWTSGTPIADVIDDGTTDSFNGRFGVGGPAMSFVPVGTGPGAPYIISIEGVELGRAGTIYIEYASGLEHLMFVESIEIDNGAVGGDYTFTVDASGEFLNVLPSGPPTYLPFIMGVGTTVEQTGATTATVRYATDTGAANAVDLHFERPTDITGGGLDVITIRSGVTHNAIVGTVFHGVPFPEEAGDEIWEDDVFKATVTGYNGTVDTVSGTSLGNVGLVFGSTFSSSEVFEYFYTRITGITADLVDSGDKPTPDLTVSALTESFSIRNESVVNETGRSYTGVALPMYCGYEAVRLDLTEDNMTGALSFTTVQDIIDQTGKIDPRNEFGFGLWMAYQGMQLADEYIPFKGIGVAGTSLSDWSAAERLLEKETFWMPIILNEDRDINMWLANYVKASATPTRKKDWRTIIYEPIPTEAFPTTIGTSLAGATNGSGTETIFDIDLSSFNVAAALLAANITPAAVTTADGLYIQISGGGATETQATYKWLISSVTAPLNRVTVTISPADTAFYHTSNPPVVTNATLTMYKRGAAVTDAEDQGTALQALADVIQDARVSICPNDGVDAPDYNGLTQRLAGYFGLATLAGYIQTHEIEHPVSGWTIPHLSHVYGTNEKFNDVDSIMKLFFLVNNDDAGTVEVGMDFTTDATSVKTHRFTVGCQLDALAIRIRDSVKSWKKMSISQRTLETLYAQVHSAGDATMQEREISRFDLDTIELGSPDFSEGGDPNQTVTDIEAVTIYGSAETFIPVGKLFIYITV